MTVTRASTDVTALPQIVTATEAADVANAVSGTMLERFVESLPAEQVPVYLARLIDAATNLRALQKGLEQRLAADGQTGQHWTIEGTEYGFFGAQAKGWLDIPNLVDNLIRLGISPRSLADAISELRITDLRQMVTVLTDPEDRAAALELIEGARIPKGARGAPRFQAITDYVTTK